MQCLAVLVALAIVLCAVVAPAQGEECNERCKLLKKRMQFRKDVQECRQKYNYTRGGWAKKQCNATLDKTFVQSKVCVNRIKGIMYANYSVNTQWTSNSTQNRQDKCIAYNEIVKENEGWSDQHMERFCNRTSTVKAIMDKCLQAGKEAEKADDEGVSAMRAMMQCHCEAFVTAWQKKKKEGGEKKGEEKKGEEKKGE